MIAVDTNVLVYAHRRDSEFHLAARECVRQLAESRAAWSIPWPCLHEFFSIVTHRRIYSPPSTTSQALTQIDEWLSSPSLTLLTETVKHWEFLRSVARVGSVAGPLIHDGRIAALCLQHEVSELWTCDRDFHRFPALHTRNPLINN